MEETFKTYYYCKGEMQMVREEVNFNDLANGDWRASVSKMDNRFVYEHIAELSAAAGINPDELFEMCRQTFFYDNDITLILDYEEVIEEALKKGISIASLFAACKPIFESTYNWRGYDSKEAIDIAKFFAEKGLDTETVKGWIIHQIEEGPLLRNMYYEPKTLESLKYFGVTAEEYVDLFIDEYGLEYIYEICASENAQKLDDIPMDRLVTRFPYSDLIAAAGDELLDFIPVFIEFGGSIEVLAKKYVDDVGYTGIEWDVRDTVGLIRYDEACKQIDFNAFAKSIDPDMFDEEDECDMEALEFLYDRFAENGVDPELLQKFTK